MVAKFVITAAERLSYTYTKNNHETIVTSYISQRCLFHVIFLVILMFFFCFFLSSALFLDLRGTAGGAAGSLISPTVREHL